MLLFSLTGGRTSSLGAYIQDEYCQILLECSVTCIIVAFVRGHFQVPAVLVKKSSFHRKGMNLNGSKKSNVRSLKVLR